LCSMYSQSFHVPLDQPAEYRIAILGLLEDHLVERLGDLRVSRERTQAGEVISVLNGELVDQAALIGVLVQLYNRGHCLLSLERTGSTCAANGA
jgi:hypothetical protein